MKLIEGYDNHIEAERLQLDPAEQLKVCQECDGTGEVEISIWYVDSKRRAYERVKCDACNGTGKVDK